MIIGFEKNILETIKHKKTNVDWMNPVFENEEGLHKTRPDGSHAENYGVPITEEIITRVSHGATIDFASERVYILSRFYQRKLEEMGATISGRRYSFTFDGEDYVYIVGEQSQKWVAEELYRKSTLGQVGEHIGMVPFAVVSAVALGASYVSERKAMRRRLKETH